MGRLESLTALALGRGHYEDEVLESTDGESSRGTQQYNDRGYPRNPETKRREREHVRAANEVMQVTGVVEDMVAAKIKANQYSHDKNQETFTGLRLMEAGRAVLVGGVWGVLGLRRRILLYKSYAHMGVYQILRHESSAFSVSHLFFSGLPTVIVYHASDWLAFFAETVLEALFDEEEDKLSDIQMRVKKVIRGLLDLGFTYVTLNLSMFAILQQLNLIPSSRLLPSLGSFVPFSAASPLQLPPSPSLNASSIISWGSALFQIVTPMLVILVHGKVRYFVARIMYRPIYKSLPRPTGDSMFSGLPISAPLVEYDSPDRNPEERTTFPTEDEPTLRALEGLPALDRSEPRPRRERDQDSTDDEEDEMTHATLISFDVEATEPIESSLGTWSAELRSANEPKVSKDVKYRVTGLTMLPPIMATEGLREIVSGIIVMPLEALMIRVLGRAYRASRGLGTEDLHPPSYIWVPGFGNLLTTMTIQLAFTGIIWAGFTFGTQLWARSKREALAAEADKEAPSN